MNFILVLIFSLWVQAQESVPCPPVDIVKKYDYLKTEKGFKVYQDKDRKLTLVFGCEKPRDTQNVELRRLKEAGIKYTVIDKDSFYYDSQAEKMVSRVYIKFGKVKLYQFSVTVFKKDLALLGATHEDVLKQLNALKW